MFLVDKIDKYKLHIFKIIRPDYKYDKLFSIIFTSFIYGFNGDK